MALIAKSTIQEVIDRMDAVALVGEYVRLEQRGGRYWGLCPFHQEKTGSFTVNPELKVYHCFGCGKGGTIINFIMEMDKMSFPEAVEFLAKKTGVEIVYERQEGGAPEGKDGEGEKRREQLFDLYRRMAVTFHHFLVEKAEGEAAKRYISERGISSGMIERFRLGYAPADKRWMYQFLSAKGYSEQFLGASGLFSSRYVGFPLFADRLMFPIADRQGRTVAFGGRILRGEGPKYINSPELEIYKKGQTLFAIDLALPEIRRTKTVYIAEGYMDVIALHQAGISNAVAPLGTAFTEDQAKLLRRWAEKVFLVFDSDTAGQVAAVKGVLTCRKNGLFSAVVVPGGEGGREEGPELKDPADILKNFGPDALQNKLKCFINDFDYLVSRARFTHDVSGSEGKARAVAFLFPYLEALDSEVSRESCFEAAAEAFGIPVQAVAADFRNRGRNPGPRPSKEEFPREAKSISMNDELFLLTLVLVNFRLYPQLRKALSIREITDPAAKELFIAMEECFVNDESGMDSLLSRISAPELRNFILERGASKEFSINPEQLLADGINRTRRKRLERRSDEIVRALRALKNNASLPDVPAKASAEELLAEKMQVDEELRKLKEDKP
jgi:DNA primase